MKDIMIDIETLDNKVTSAILSIALVQFDSRTGKIGDSAYYRIGYKNAKESKGTVNADTLKWWEEQDEEVYNSQFYPPKPVSTARALEGVFNFFHNLDHPAEDLRPWGNGPSFDISILEYNMLQVGVPVPWKYRNIRDVRTCRELGEVNSNHLQFKGNRHDPIDDCRHQIKVVSMARKRIGDGCYDYDM